MSRPHIVLSAATSLDGYLDDASDHRLLLSNAADFDRVDELRATSDAIMIGANTIRRDNPRLTVKSSERRARRISAGKPANPRKTTLTNSGNLDPTAHFWHTGIEAKPLVYTTPPGARALATQFTELTRVVTLTPTVNIAAVVDDLATRGIRRLLVEGGGHLLTAFLAADLADELLIAIAPQLVGNPRAPRFLHPANFPGAPTHRMHLANVTQISDIALLHYFPKR